MGHPQVYTLTPRAWERDYRAAAPIFDAVVSYSSLEHSGLGRYGDGLDPWSDVINIAQAHCLTRRGGHLLLGLPTSYRGHSGDYVEWTAHRLYGKARWPLIT